MTPKTKKIKSLYKKLNSKNDFLFAASKKFNRKPMSLSHNWFTDSGLWSVPDSFQDDVISLLEETIENQNKVEA